MFTGNVIGLDPTGTIAEANGSSGIEIAGGMNATIGGVTASARNVIAGNTGYGISVHPGASANVLIEGNYLGTDVTGTKTFGSEGGDVSVSGSGGVTVGGAAPGAGNLISSATSQNIDVSGGSGDLIQGNLIGTDATGSVAISTAAGASNGFASEAARPG